MTGPRIAVDYPEPRHQAAIVELMGVHEECTPALAHLLRLNAVEPTIYLNGRIRDARPGFKVRFPEIKDAVRFVDLNDRQAGKKLWRRLSKSDADLLLINSFQTDGHARSLTRWEGPALGVVHNARMLHDNEQAREAVSSGRIGLLTLAPHVTAHLQTLDPTVYAGAASATSTYPAPPRVKPVVNDRRTVALPGSINFASRDYGQVLDALPGILDQVGHDRLRVSVVGGGGFGATSGPENRRRLVEEVTRRGLADAFQFAPINERGFVPSGPYFAYLRGADFILPAVPPDDPGFRTYKISSAFPTSAGIGVPAILDSWSAEVYGIPGVVHEVGKVTEGLATAAAMSDDEVLALRADLADYRERVLARAAEEMGRALKAQGLG